MKLNHISLLNYKNLEEVDLHFSSNLNCFLGQNGMGKTNLLDAIYFLSFCKSAFNPIDSQNILHDRNFFVIQGSYQSENGEVENIYCGLKRRVKKQFKRNKKEYPKLSEHIGLLPLVMVSPSDSSLILGGSEGRRKFIDVVLSQFDKHYLDALISYNAAMTQRNALLKNQPNADDDLFSIWEEKMAEDGRAVFEKRKQFIEKFIPIFQQFYSFISQDKEIVSLAYESHLLEGDLLTLLQESRERDKVMGYSLKGIHKDDLKMKLSEFPLKKEGSQGQTKTYLIALKLAQYDFLKKTGCTTPILLLDDIFDKLDVDRVQQIVKLVSDERFGQIFMTDTNRLHLDSILKHVGKDFKVFDVNNGDIKERSEA